MCGQALGPALLRVEFKHGIRMQSMHGCADRRPVRGISMSELGVDVSSSTLRSINNEQVNFVIMCLWM